MKKTISITLAGILFHIEEDAYAKLSTYLESVRNYFKSEPNSTEILSDIENRISEQFLENGSRDKIVTLENVEALIASMGTVKDFGDAENTSGSEKSTSNASATKQKKLFRNPDDVVVAGVASGLAAYFDIDPIIVRLLFVLVVLAGGSGILIYIILWFVMPKAETSTEKLQMRGEKITLDAVSDIVKEKVSEVKANRGTFRKIIGFPFLVIGILARAIVPIIRKFIGGILSLASGIAMFGLVFVLSVILFNVKSPYVDFPLLQIGHPVAIYIGLCAAFFVIFVPLLFILSLGVKLVSKKNMFSTRPMISLVVLWCVAITTAGVVATKLVPEWQNFVETSPLYAETQREFYDINTFTGISGTNSTRINVTEGPEFKITATGRVKSLDELSVAVQDGVLHIGRTSHFKICIFCTSDSPEITITMPHLDNINLENDSSLTAFATSTQALKVTLSNASRANLTLNTASLDVQARNASWMTLVGTSTQANFELHNASRVMARDLHISEAKIIGENASVLELSVDKTLNANLQNASFVIYSGNPVIEKQLRNGSTIQKVGEENYEDENEGNF